MQDKTLLYYCHRFEKLRRDHRNGGAPHKPVLLISIIKAFQEGILTDENIKILPELVGLFKTYWYKLVETNHQCLFTLPFYHMRSEPFWQLIPNPGCEIWIKSKGAMRTLANLNTAVHHAQIDSKLVELFNKKEDSEVLLQFLLDTYFPVTKQRSGGRTSDYLSGITKEILEEPQEEYQKRLLEIRGRLDNAAFEEEVFVRSSVFKKEVPKVYNYSCCISGLRVDSLLNVSMVDACHIIPFAESYNDTITNGIALCPNLHRAFDRGLISIDEGYKVLVSRKFSENQKSTYSLMQFEGKNLNLPETEKYFPSSQALRQHREKHGFI